MALLALLETRQYRRFEHILDSVRWLTDIIESIGLLILHYSAFLRLVLQQIQKRGFSPESQALFDKADQLAHHNVCDTLSSLQGTGSLWTNEAWSNGYMLMSFFPCGHINLLKDPVIQKTVSWFETSIDSAGCWADVEDTCNAIRGLRALYLEREYEKAKSEACQANIIREEFLARAEAELREHFRSTVKRGSLRTRILSQDPEGGTTIYLSKRLKMRIYLAITVLLTLSGIIAFGEQITNFVKSLVV